MIYSFNDDINRIRNESTYNNKPDIVLKKPTGKVPVNNDYNGDQAVNIPGGDLLKGYMPYFLYKPPYGYPRNDLDISLIRTLGNTPYIFSIKKAIVDRISSLKWDIKVREGVVDTPELTKKKFEIIDFFKNPNRNKQSLNEIQRALIFDLLDFDAGVIVKVFNVFGDFTQFIPYPGETFLKNPDIHNYIGERADFVDPNYTIMPDNDNNRTVYGQLYNEKAAYYQYAYTPGSMPIPFGKREVVYFALNPQTGTPYGISPVLVLQEVIMILLYGGRYNLDMFTGNVPPGIISLLSAKDKQIKNVRKRLDEFLYEYDAATKSWRKKNYKIPIVNVDAKFIPYKIPSKDMEVLAGQQWFWKIALSVFGLNSDEMGDTQNSNKATGSNQSSKIPKRALQPITKLLEYKYTTEILYELDPDHYFEFVFDLTDIGEELAKADLYTKKLAWLKINEVRELDGRLPIDEGNKLTSSTPSFNQNPFNGTTSLNNNTPNQEVQEQKSVVNPSNNEQDKESELNTESETKVKANKESSEIMPIKVPSEKTINEFYTKLDKSIRKVIMSKDISSIDVGD